MKTIVITFLFLALTSCAVQSIPEALPEAEKLNIVETSDNCRIIDIVIGSAALGTELGQDLKLAMIDAKNKAARLGADSIRILGSEDVSTRAALSSPSNSVMLEALDCN
ncbi:MAG: hypothetical protein WBW79_07530 [Desulfocapsaceae bacterium]